MGKFKSKISMGLSALLSATALVFAGPVVPAQASQSIDLYGFNVSWNDTLYFPEGCSNFEFNYANNVGYELLQVGFLLLDPYGERIANDSLIGAPSGGTGTWDEQICKHELMNGLGPYTIKVFVQDYDSRGGNTREKTAQVYFKARPGQSVPAPKWPMPPVSSGENLVDVYGFSVSWNKVLYMPDGCSNFEFRYKNNIGYELLQVGYILTNQYGDKVADDSLIGSPPGGYGTWNEQICAHELDGNLGPYTVKVFIKDYSSRGGSTRSASAKFSFTPRPQPALSNTPAPTISGNLQPGSTLYANTSGWDSGVTFTYRWLKDGQVVSTSSGYAVDSADVGASFTVEVTGSKSGYSSVTKTSAQTAAVSLATFRYWSVPKISGTAKVGKTLIVNPGLWDSGTTVSIEWLRAGVPIAGATGRTYKLTTKDKGKQISVRMVAENDGYESKTVVSAKTGKVG